MFDWLRVLMARSPAAGSHDLQWLGLKSAEAID